jgi:signal transduction histidine kinase
MTLNTRADAHVHVTGSRLQPDAAADHHLLRIGLEALTNALKHAGATRIDIELQFGIDSTDLIVIDNGRGMAAGEGATGAHFGLQGVRERVDKLGGVMQIESSPGGGTRLAVMVPVRSGGVRAAVPTGESWQTS